MAMPRSCSSAQAIAAGVVVRTSPAGRPRGAPAVLASSKHETRPFVREARRRRRRCRPGRRSDGRWPACRSAARSSGPARTARSATASRTGPRRRRCAAPGPVEGARRRPRHPGRLRGQGSADLPRAWRRPCPGRRSGAPSTSRSRAAPASRSKPFCGSSRPIMPSTGRSSAESKPSSVSSARRHSALPARSPARVARRQRLVRRPGPRPPCRGR